MTGDHQDPTRDPAQEAAREAAREAAGEPDREPDRGAARLDLVTGVRLPDGRLVDLAIGDGVVTSVSTAGQDGPLAGHVLAAAGAVVVPGLVDAHVHLDKAFLLETGDRIRDGAAVGAGVAGAIAAMAEIRRHVGPEVVLAGARRALETLVAHGVVAARAHAEVDRHTGRDLIAMHQQLRAEYAGVIDLQVTAFPQNGIGGSVLADLTAAAANAEVQVIAGCPYVDEDDLAHLDAVFALAERFGLPLDLHLDFDDDPGGSLIGAVAERTRSHGMGGQVTIGHATKLAAMDATTRAAALADLAEAGVALVVMPATDLYLCGAGDPRTGTGTRSMAPLWEAAEAGVRVAVTNNNLANDFAPYGNGRLLQAAWVAGIVGRVRGTAAQTLLLDAITLSPGRILGLAPHGPVEGATAHLAILDTHDPTRVVHDAPSVDATVHAGRVVRLRPSPTLTRHDQEVRS